MYSNKNTFFVYGWFTEIKTVFLQPFLTKLSREKREKKKHIIASTRIV